MTNPTVIFIASMGLALICIFAVAHYFMSTTSRTRHNRKSRKTWKHTGFSLLLLIPIFANAQTAPPPIPEGRYTVEYCAWVGSDFLTVLQHECIVRPWKNGVTVMECDKGYVRRDMRAVPNALLILDTPFTEVGPGQFRWTTKEGGVEYRFTLPGSNK